MNARHPVETKRTTGSDEAPVAFIDFQLVSIGGVGFDPMYFLMNSELVLLLYNAAANLDTIYRCTGVRCGTVITL
jgi:hypothetical protein